jgi:hypothetical protein
VIKRSITFLLLAVTGAIGARDLQFAAKGASNYGTWTAESSINLDVLKPADTLRIQTVLAVSSQLVTKFQAKGLKIDGFVALATAERTFDSTGWLRLAGAERMSTLLTPTGLPIEGGVFGAVTNRFGGRFRSPIDVLATVPLEKAAEKAGSRIATFQLESRVPDDMPPGIYRIRLDYGLTAGRQFYSLNGEDFARRSLQLVVSHHYSPPLRMSGLDAAGARVDMSVKVPRIPWVLLAAYNSNGYRGVVAEEDSQRFNISGRNLIQDDVILPRFDEARQPLSYSLEPQFPADGIEAQNNIPWNYASGYLSVQVVGPDGKLSDLGTLPFVGQSRLGPTTRSAKFAAWQPPGYGRYTVRATGWIEDIWGNRYAGGGTFRFWIAKRMTMSTATFQGAAYPVGSRYGREIGFAPSVPAEVDISASLFVGSNPKNVRTVVSHGTASPSGVFGTAQGMKLLPLDAPGEYSAHILARYTDASGHLWVCTMRHAGVVYPEQSPVAAHGKKLDLAGKFVDRGETKTEGSGHSSLTGDYTQSVLNFPYLAGDVLLIASEQEAANVISPVLTVEWKSKPEPYDPAMKELGATNVRIQTSNGLSPHLFPEFITQWAYYYAGAPRPGLMSSFFVGEDGVRLPWWATSPNDFGGQINASANGDLPGDIYRFLGGVVVRKPEAAAVYAGYMASGFILPGKTNNNRVIAAGDEDLLGPDGSKARFWLVGTRPGSLYETGRSFAPAVQVDPLLPVAVTFTLHYPDGRVAVATGAADRFGVFLGTERWMLDVPGVYRYTIEAEWHGHKGRMPGLPAEGGYLYVAGGGRRPGASELRLDLKPETLFTPGNSLPITGKSTAKKVWYSAIIPGAVMDQGELPVMDGKFEYLFDPASIARKIPTYDTLNLVGFVSDLKRVVHLTFFSEEVSPAGTPNYAFTRLIVRGNKILYTR